MALITKPKNDQLSSDNEFLTGNNDIFTNTKIIQGNKTQTQHKFPENKIEKSTEKEDNKNIC